MKFKFNWPSGFRVDIRTDGRANGRTDDGWTTESLVYFNSA